MQHSYFSISLRSIVAPLSAALILSAALPVFATDSRGEPAPTVIPVADGLVAVAADGQCSLIEAFENAVDQGATHADCEPGSPAGTTIVLAADAEYVLTTVHNTNDGGNGLPVLDIELVVEGNGATISRDGGAQPLRLLKVAAGGDVALFDVALAGGSLFGPEERGSGIHNVGALSLERVRMTGNGGAAAGALYSEGVVDVTHSTFAQNGGGGAGAGIHNAFGGELTVSHSTFMQNSCAGGGCAMQNEGEAYVINSTISANGGPFAGGIVNIGTLELTHVTLTDNGGSSARSLQNNGIAIVRNSLFAGTPPDAGPTHPTNCDGAPVTFEGVNLVDDGSCGCTAPACLDQQADLGPLQDNGGATHTHAMLEDSPGLDQADGAHCPADDQRGVSRPQGEGCDIGAYESEFVAQPELGLTPPALNFGEVDVGTASLPLQTTLHNNGNADATGISVSDPGNGFTVDSSQCGSVLEAGASCAISVTFEPGAEGPANAILTVSSNEIDPVTASLSGIGVVEPEDIIFADRFQAGGVP